SASARGRVRGVEARPGRAGRTRAGRPRTPAVGREGRGASRSRSGMIAAARRADPFALLLAVVILAATTWPYVAGYRAATPDLRFLGFVDNPTDANPYVSWIRQAAAGRVMIESRYSPEPVPAHLFNLMTFALGLVSRVTGMPAVAAWQAGRIAFGAALL